jgi:DNA-binding PadR family transcriptional regulator
MLLSRGSESGYSIMQKIDERTDGAWRPGAGTVYPLLRGLVEDGFVRSSGDDGRASRKAYSLTSRGERELQEIKRTMAAAGRKERVLTRLFSDLLPGSVLVPMIVGRFREGTEVFRQKVMEIPQPDRDSLLKEFRLLMETQLQWIDSQLERRVQASRPPARSRGRL